jgi:hypothetical protein
MKDFPVFDRRLHTAASHLRDLAGRFELSEVPASKWVNVLALSLPEGDHVRTELQHMYREAGESYEDFYRRAVQLFKDRYKPTEVEIGNYLTQLHTMAKV